MRPRLWSYTLMPRSASRAPDEHAPAKGICKQPGRAAGPDKLAEETLSVRESIVVEISDLKVSKDPNVELITYSLGSCIGVAIWDPQARVGGMLHYMLAESRLAPARAKTKPAMFADTGIPLLFRSVYALGGVKRRLIVKVAGGAAMFQTKEEYDIGRHNYIFLRRIFWRNGILITSEHVGGCISRTMRLNIGTGRVSVANQHMKQLVI
jgi:chemotaxis protein CheD